MSVRGSAALLSAMMLASGCFQEETPRRDSHLRAANTTSQTQHETAAALAREPDEKPYVPALAESLRHEADPDERRETIYSIADAAAADGAAIIGQSLTDPDPLVRRAAIEAMTGIQDPTAADWLSIGIGDPDPRVRQSAVEALGVVGGGSARFLLEQALLDAEPTVREAAEQMLAEPALAAREVR